MERPDNPDGKLAFVMIKHLRDPLAPVKAFDLIKQHGYDPSWGDSDPHWGTMITFPVPDSYTPADLDFLRPQYLPPL